jgi:hypothetical protein
MRFNNIAARTGFTLWISMALLVGLASCSAKTGTSRVPADLHNIGNPETSAETQAIDATIFRFSNAENRANAAIEQKEKEIESDNFTGFQYGTIAIGAQGLSTVLLIASSTGNVVAVGIIGVVAAGLTAGQTYFVDHSGKKKQELDSMKQQKKTWVQDYENSVGELEKIFKKISTKEEKENTVSEFLVHVNFISSRLENIRRGTTKRCGNRMKAA